MKRTGVLLLLAAGSTLLTTGCASEPPLPPGSPPGTVAGSVRVKDLPLSDAFVYVKQGLEGRRFDVPAAPVILDQKSNQFVPRVFGIRAGQTLKITSQDYGLHNVTCTPFNNAEFNETLLGQQSLTRKFEKPEVMIQFRCNIHGSMTAWVGVLDHPYFAVTGPDGQFEFRGLPPGEYVVEAWHEYYGSRRTQIRVGDVPVPPLRFTF